MMNLCKAEINVPLDETASFLRLFKQKQLTIIKLENFQFLVMSAPSTARYDTKF